MPLFKEVGVYCFACLSVGLSVRRPNGFQVITKKRLGLRNFKLSMMIVHDQYITPIDFGVKGQDHIDLVGKNGF
jgi:hypothetical protein